MQRSGAGKSTFLDILSGHSKSGTVLGNILVDNVPVPIKKLRKIVGYVDQEDLLLPTLTVRETLMFSACVRLPECITYQEKMKRVEEVMESLGLSHVADEYVGGGGNRGISGGEKRRVSIGIELVTSPPVLLLDEPTRYQLPLKYSQLSC
jgi:ABC-type multidrug transport system ATPase subunit